MRKYLRPIFLFRWQPQKALDVECEIRTFKCSIKISIINTTDIDSDISNDNNNRCILDPSEDTCYFHRRIMLDDKAYIIWGSIRKYGGKVRGFDSLHHFQIITVIIRN